MREYRPSLSCRHRANAMDDNTTQSIRESYDGVADEYAVRVFNELQHKPLDRELLNRFAAEMAGRGTVCDMGCGPGHVARYLRDVGISVFGLDLSPRMTEQARRLNPDISFREGNMMGLGLEDRTLAGITAFYAIVNIPKESLPLVFRGMRRGLQPGGQLLLAFHTKFFRRRSGGGGRSQWIFSFFSHWQSDGTWRPLGLALKRLSSAGLTRRTWSTRAEERIFLRGNPDSPQD